MKKKGKDEDIKTEIEKTNKRKNPKKGKNKERKNLFEVSRSYIKQVERVQHGPAHSACKKSRARHMSTRSELGNPIPRIGRYVATYHVPLGFVVLFESVHSRFFPIPGFRKV